VTTHRWILTEELKVNRLFNAEDSRKLNMINIELVDGFNKVMSLNDGKVPGDDIIHEFLKRVACEISELLAILYN